MYTHMASASPGLPFFDASIISAALSRAACASFDGMLAVSIVFVLGGVAKPDVFHDEEPDILE